MTVPHICPECRATLRADAPLGLCPSCLVRMGRDILTRTEPPSANGLDFGCVGNYELIEEIARGGMGVVFKARQTRLNRIVAVKMIVSGGFASEEALDRFRAEAEALALLQHPNIVSIHEIGEWEGRPYFSMDYVPGKSLAELARVAPLPPRRAAECIHTVALAVQYAHDHGILHRDLKPANILMDADGHPRVTDFGLAKQISSGNSGLTMTGQVLGSPNFVPPEQAGGRAGEVGPRSDVYSIGAILYHVLTGHPPFAGATLETTLSMVLNADAVAPRLLNSGIPRDLETICLKCLEKEPGRRYQTAQELAEDLARFLNNEPTHARPINSAGRMVRWSRRRPAVAGLALAVILACATGLTGIVLQSKRAEEHARNEKRERERAERTITRLEIERAELFFRDDRAGDALANLARVLKREPTNRIAAERIMAALSARNFCVPAVPPLEHQDAITSATFSPNGSTVLTSSRDHTARLWDSRTGQPVLSPLRHDAAVLWASFSRDGKWIITASLDATARIWESDSGRRFGPALQHKYGLSHAEFSPDGTLAVTAATNGTFRVWRVRDGTAQTAVFGEPVNATGACIAHFSPAGSKLVTISGPTIQFWNPLTGSVLLTQRSDVSFAEFSPDGNHVAAGGASWVLRFLSPESGATLHDANDSMPLVCGQFSPNGERFAMGTKNGTVRIVDGKTAEPKLLLKHRGQIASVVFSPDSNWLLTASQDGSARIWNVQTGEPVTEPIQHDAPVSIAQFRQDMRRVITVPVGNAAWVWEVRSGPPIPHECRTDARAFGAWFNRSGDRLLTTPLGLERPSLWDARRNRLLVELSGSAQGIWQAEFSPDETRIVTSGQDGKARVSEAATGKLLWELDHQGEVHTATFSPTGNLILTASTDKTATLWNAHTGTRARVLAHQDTVRSAHFSPDGTRIITSSDDHSARVWDAATGEALLRLSHNDAVTWASFSKNGGILATASKDRSARLWNGLSGRLLHRPMNHAEAVEGLAFSPDGKRLVTRSGSSARVWDVATAQPLTDSLKHEGRINSVRFSPDGLRLVTSSDDMTLRIWDTETGHPLSEPMRHSHLVSYAEFSPDGDWISSASVNVHLWQAPKVEGSVPAWLSSLAEGIAGRRYNSRGESEPVSPKETLSIRRELSGQTLKDESLRKWGLWFLTAVDERPVSSLSSLMTSNSPPYLRARASVLMGRGKPTEALPFMARAVELDSSNVWTWDWFYVAMLIAQQGDDNRYREFCHTMLVRFGDTANRVIARRIALSCLLLPVADRDLPAVGKLIERSLANGHDYREFAKGLFEYRSGRWEEAVTWMESALSKPEFFARDAQAWILLAMARQRLKDSAAARTALAKGRAAAEKTPQLDSGEFDDKGWYNTGYAKDWYNWLVNSEIRLFLQEAEALIESDRAGRP